MSDVNVAHKLPEVLLAVEKGITISGTAVVLKCSRNTVRNYCKRWKVVADALAEKRTELVDLAEMGLRGAVLKQEPWAVTFALRTLAREIYNDQGNPPGPPPAPVKYIVLESARARVDPDPPILEGQAADPLESPLDR